MLEARLEHGPWSIMHDVKCVFNVNQNPNSNFGACLLDKCDRSRKLDHVMIAELY